MAWEGGPALKRRRGKEPILQELLEGYRDTCWFAVSPALPFVWTAGSVPVGPQWNTGLAIKPPLTHKPQCHISAHNVFSAGKYRYVLSQFAYKNYKPFWLLNMFLKDKCLWNTVDLMKAVMIRSESASGGKKKTSAFSIKLLSQYWHLGINLGWQQDRLYWDWGWWGLIIRYWLAPETRVEWKWTLSLAVWEREFFRAQTE